VKKRKECLVTRADEHIKTSVYVRKDYWDLLGELSRRNYRPKAYYINEALRVYLSEYEIEDEED
jgi:predicted DNA-binding protein